MNRQQIEPILEDPKGALKMWNVAVRHFLCTLDPANQIREIHKYLISSTAWSMTTGLATPAETSNGF